jgi:PAS domain S-box-containing protein
MVDPGGVMTEGRLEELEERIKNLAFERDLYKTRYDHLMKYTPTGIYEVDFESQSFVRWNDEILDIMGYSWEEFLDLSPLEILSPESQIAFIERLTKVLEGEEVPDHADYEVVKKSGENFPVRIFPRYLKRDGMVTGAVVIAKDRREEMELQRKVDSSEEKYRKLVENANEAIFVIQDGVFKYMNRRVKDFIGYSREDLLGREFLSIIHPEDHEIALKNHMDRLKGGGPSEPYNLRIIKKDGSIATGDIGGVLIDWEGRPATLSFGLDVTERVKTERLLKASEVKFRTYTEQSLIAICILQDGVCKYANRKLSEMFRYSLEEIYDFGPDEWLKTIHPDFRDLLSEQAGKKQKGERQVITNYSYKAFRKDGREIWINQFSKTIQFEGRNADMAMLLDVTNEREALEKLREETRRSELYLDLLGHDIGNLHQGISNWLDLAKRGMEDQTRVRMALAQSSYLVKRSVKLVRNILLLSRLKSLEPDLERIDLISLIEKPMREVTNLFPDRNIKMNLHVSDDELPVMAEGIIEEVFFNLIHNAVKFQTGGDPMVDIFGQRDGQEVIITVEDVGPGISDREKELLFERTRGSNKGTHSGIGLSLVRELISRYNGSISVEDTIEGDHTKGARFKVILPLAEEIS